MILLDTCILSAYSLPLHPKNEEVTNRISDLFQQKREMPLIVAPQCLFEFYVVATRPMQANGLGWSGDFTMQMIQKFETLFDLLPDSSELYEVWKTLVVRFGVSGKTAHDTRLVAWMLTHSIPKIYTLNKNDFQRYSSIIELL